MTVVDAEIIYGIHPVLEALRLRPEGVLEIVVQEAKAGGKTQEVLDLAREKRRPIRFAARLPDPGKGQAVIHQGVMARLAPLPTLSLEELLTRIRCRTAPLLVALDSIQDPHNLGAIIRSAVAAGAAGIILPRDRTAPLSGTAVKASAGAVSHVDICRVTNLARALERVKEAGFWIFGTDGQAPQTIYEVDLKGSACLVIGGEGKGVRPLVREHCDFLVSIPMQGSLNSLNASVAAGIVLFERVRQLGVLANPA